MKSTIILGLLIFLTSSALQIQELVSEEGTGQWSDLIQAKLQYANIPSQYFLCGMDFLQHKWEVSLRNCECGLRWYRGRRRPMCNICVNSFWNQACGFSATFCHYTNWNDQIVRQFTTNSTKAGNWKGRVMCPSQTYATGFKGHFGTKHVVSLGFHGMVLKCMTPDYKFAQSVKTVEDSQYNTTQWNVPRYGLFLSSFKLRYEPENILTGIQMFAEGMPLISSIKIDYDLNSAYENYPVIIDSLLVQNCGRQTSQRRINFTKNYETMGTWLNHNPQVKGYLLSPKITMLPPAFKTLDSIGMLTPYKSIASQFQFETPVKTSIVSTQEVPLTFLPYVELNIKIVVQERTGLIPFTATLTMINRLTDEKLTDYNITGTWDGTTISAVDIVIENGQAVCNS